MTPDCGPGCGCGGGKPTRREFLSAAAAAGAVAAFAGPFTLQDTADHFVPADKKLDPKWVEALFRPGERTWFSGKDLETIGMPVGGICAGQVYLSGDGRLIFSDIFNTNHNTGWGANNYKAGRKPTEWSAGEGKRFIDAPPVDQGFAVRVRAGGKTIERPLDAANFRDVRFCGEYPIGFVDYADPDVPLAVGLEAFSPFIPLNAADSALPAVLLNFTVKNTGTEEAEVAITGRLQNAVCWFSGPGLGDARRINSEIRESGLAGVFSRVVRSQGDQRLSDKGSMGLWAPGPALVATEHEKPMDQPLRGTVERALTLKPGETGSVSFVITWHMPNLYFSKGGQTSEGTYESFAKIAKQWVGRYYVNRFDDAAEVARYVAANFDRLAGETRRWHRAWYDSTLPRWLLDRIGATNSTPATNTCQWWKDGRFWAWEGVGCCAGTCGHVWNYAHAVARLFPELERSAREMQDFKEGVGIRKNGAIYFRGESAGNWAGDAQAGYILKAWREHQCSADDAFLHRVWPAVRKAMEFLIGRDMNSDGLIEGKQHNTYDIDFYGANTMVGSMYLAALRAAEEMAREAGDGEFAGTCRKIFESGRKLTVERLFNGEYFRQEVDLKKRPKDQYAEGCLSDHLFGQGWAHMVNLGYVYPRETVLSALKAVWKYNWAPDVAPQNKAHTPDRWFAYPGEAGLFTCTWPRSKHMGKTSVLYRDEVWTGIEYQVAGHMAWEGMVTEALAVCRAVHERYHPSKRNPFNEIECGDHYARCMAAWGVLAGLSGFEYHGPRGRLGFAPRMTPEDFRAPFTAAEGWGMIVQKREGDTQINRVAVKWGKVPLKTLAVLLPAGARPAEVKAELDGKALEVSHQAEGGRVVVTLPEGTTVGEDQELALTVRCPS